MQYDTVVIGAGPGGYIAAVRLAQLGVKTACIEAEPHLGGKCLNLACIPSKTLLQASEAFQNFLQEAKNHNVEINHEVLDLTAIMKRKNKVIDQLACSVSTLFAENNVDLIVGQAKITDPHTIVATLQDGQVQKIKTNSIVLATGSAPIQLPFLRFDEKKVLSSSGAMSLEKLPKSMIVIGGGAVGVEMASIYSRFGTKVTVIEQMSHICPEIDLSMSNELLRILKKQDISFSLNTQVLSATDLGAKGIEIGVRLPSGQERKMHADVVLVAIGRHPHSYDMGLSKLKVDKTGRGAVIVDDHFRTTVPNIYAIGDLIDGPGLAHRASYEGVQVAEIIAGKAVKLDYSIIPNIIYTSPEVATVGLSVDEAKELERPIKVGKCQLKVNARAEISGETDGFCLVVADSQTERILGVHILAPKASEMIAVAGFALSKRATLKELASLPFAHPTFSEIIKEACLDAMGRSDHLF